MIEADTSGNYYGTAQKQSIRTKTPIAATAPTSTGIAVDVEDDDAGEGEGESGEKPHKRSQLDAAGKTQKKSILTVHDTTIKHLTAFEKLVLNEMVTAGQAVIVSEIERSDRIGQDHYGATLRS